MFKAFTTSFKHFKDCFFKVGSSEEELSFFLDEEGKEKYLLYWQSEPNPLLEVEYGSLGPEDQALVDTFTLSPQLESAKLVELGEDPQALAEYMGMFVTMQLGFALFLW